MKKFDVCLMNPPFKQLDILFLEKMLTIADLIVHIGPDTILLNNKKYKYEDTILKHIKNVDTIDVEEANTKFMTGFINDICILTLDNDGGFDYNNYKRDSIISKISAKMSTSIKDVLEYNKIDGIRVKIVCMYHKYSPNLFISYQHPIIDGKLLNGDDFTTIRTSLKDKNTLCLSIRFNTINEAYNFINSIISGSYYYYYCYKFFSGRNPFWKKIPFMNDYTKPWTDERLKEYFGLTDEEYNIVKNYDKRNK